MKRPSQRAAQTVYRVLTLLAVIAFVSATQEPIAEEPIIVDPYPPESSEHGSIDALIGILSHSAAGCGSVESDDPKTWMDIPVNVCASARFPLDLNVVVDYPGLCSGGASYPSLVLYSKAGCVGSEAPADFDWGITGQPVSTGVPQGYCLSKSVWGPEGSKKRREAPDGDWSLMFRCGGDGVIPSGRMKLVLPPPTRPSTALVSDSSCFIPQLGPNGRPDNRFGEVIPDLCVNIAPLRRLVVQRNALCPGGKEAELTVWSGTGCESRPNATYEEDEMPIETERPYGGIEMGGQRAGSYAFTCGSYTNIDRSKAAEGLQEEDQKPILWRGGPMGLNVVDWEPKFSQFEDLDDEGSPIVPGNPRQDRDRDLASPTLIVSNTD